jgi:hypothetical protein
MNCGVIVAGDPANAGVLIVPAGVSVWLCVPSNAPANEGVLIVPAGVNAAVPFVPVAVNVWL